MPSFGWRTYHPKGVVRDGRGLGQRFLPIGCQVSVIKVYFALCQGLGWREGVLCPVLALDKATY